MLIHLIHNPQAGLATQEMQRLVHEISKAGHQVIQSSLVDDFVHRPCDMIAAAGGDGTIETVVRQLYKYARNPMVPLLIIPQGTANNIAKSLGVSIDIAPSTGRALQPRATKTLTVGKLFTPHLSRLFVESVGCGLVTRLIQTVRPESTPPVPSKQQDQRLPPRQLSLLFDLIDALEAPHYHLVIDGVDYSGRYLLVEIMNIAQIGPQIPLAPGKDPGGETADVVFIDGGQKEHLKDFLRALDRNSAIPYPFTRIAGKQITITCVPSDLHVDDTPFAGGQTTEYSVYAGVHRVAIADLYAHT